MFSFLGLSVEQAQRLREEQSVYMLDSSRINIAGLNANNLGRVVEAVAAVLICSVAFSYSPLQFNQALESLIQRFLGPRYRSQRSGDLLGWLLIKAGLSNDVQKLGVLTFE